MYVCITHELKPEEGTSDPENGGTEGAVHQHVVLRVKLESSAGTGEMTH